MGFGVGATLPTATRAMQHWVEASKRGFAQGITHAFARLGNAATPLLIAALMAVVDMARLVCRGRVGGLRLGPGLATGISATIRRTIPSITREELAVLPPARKGPRPIVPWGPLIQRMWPVTLTYFCYGWCLWLYLNWLPLFFKNTYSLDIKQSAIFATIVYTIGAIGNTLGGIASDRILHKTGNVRFARIGMAAFGFTAARCSRCFRSSMCTTSTSSRSASPAASSSRSW